MDNDPGWIHERRWQHKYAAQPPALLASRVAEQQQQRQTIQQQALHSAAGGTPRLGRVGALSRASPCITFPMRPHQSISPTQFGEQFLDRGILQILGKAVAEIYGLIYFELSHLAA